MASEETIRRPDDGNLFVVDEHAERLWLPQRHAAAIAAMVANHSGSDSALRALARTN